MPAPWNELCKLYQAISNSMNSLELHVSIRISRGFSARKKAPQWDLSMPCTTPRCRFVPFCRWNLGQVDVTLTVFVEIDGPQIQAVSRCHEKFAVKFRRRRRKVGGWSLAVPRALWSGTQFTDRSFWPWNLSQFANPQTRKNKGPSLENLY